MKTAVELARELESRRAEQSLKIAEIKTAAPEAVEGLRVEIKNRDSELGKLHDEWVKARELEAIEKRNEEEIHSLKAAQPRVPFSTTQGDPQGVEERGAEQRYAATKSLGQQFVESDEYKSMRGATKPQYTVEIGGMTLKTAMQAATLSAIYGDAIKTVMTTAAGIVPYPPQQADVVPIARRRATVADLMPQSDTEASAIIYLEQTTATNNAAATAEGASKPESALAYTRRTVPLEVIAHLLPVTNQELEDIPGVRAIIDQELVEMLRLAEEDEILNGDGSTPNLVGIINKSGVQSQAKGADDIFTAAMKAFTLVRHTGFADVSAGVMHPNDWLSYATAQDSTGRFIYGNPADNVEPRIWGVPIIVTTAMTENTGLFGDFRMYARLWRKGGIRVDVGYINDDFGKNQQTIRVEERVALQIRRPAAFCKLTGI